LQPFANFLCFLIIPYCFPESRSEIAKQLILLSINKFWRSCAGVVTHVFLDLLPCQNNTEEIWFLFVKHFQFFRSHLKLQQLSSVPNAQPILTIPWWVTSMRQRPYKRKPKKNLVFLRSLCFARTLLCWVCVASFSMDASHGNTPTSKQPTIYYTLVRAHSTRCTNKNKARVTHRDVLTKLVTEKRRTIFYVCCELCFWRPRMPKLHRLNVKQFIWKLELGVYI